MRVKTIKRPEQFPLNRFDLHLEQQSHSQIRRLVQLFCINLFYTLAFKNLHFIRFCLKCVSTSSHCVHCAHDCVSGKFSAFLYFDNNFSPPPSPPPPSGRHEGEVGVHASLQQGVSRSSLLVCSDDKEEERP